MSTHDARHDRGRDDWEVTGRDTSALVRGLHAMADDVPPHPLDAHLDTVRGRVRRRRAAKKAGAGVVTLGVVGALGVALAQVPTWDTAPPPPAAPSVPEPTAPSGYQPPWLEGTPVACGMTAEALAAITDPTLALTTHGPSTEVPGVADVTLENVGPAAVVGATPTIAPVAWVRDGVVVAVGPNAFESPLAIDLAPGEDVSLGAEAVVTDYCRPRADGEFHETVPAGDYELVPYQGVLPEGLGADDVLWAVGEPVAVTLDADGSIVPRD